MSVPLGARRAPSPLRSRRGAAAPFLVGAVAAIFAVGSFLWVRSMSPLRYSDLRNDPAFALRMDGADELAEVGGEARTGVDGSTPTFAGHIFGTTAASAQVYAYYERELTRLGWHAQPPPFAMSTAEIENRLYCTDKASFRLAIEDRDRAFQPAFYRGRTYATVFDATLIAVGPGQPCPRRPLPTATPIP